METLTRTSSDPRFSKPSPPFSEQKPIKPPGSETEMSPRPDHGEDTYMGSDLLSGRAALITGADSGIGRAVALAFAAEGANVAISYLNESEDARQSAEAVRARGRRALVLPGDLQDQAYCEKLIERTASEFGRLDILVNNAAYQIVNEETDDLGLEEFERAFRTNVFATFLLSKHALRRMKPGSVIINTTSIQAFEPNGSLLAYAATKGAIANFTRALAQVAIEKGVRVNGVAPGPVWTPLIPSTMPPEEFKDFGANTVFKRPAQPAELAPVYVFLASDKASYVTGEIYGATGGRMPL